MAGDLEQKLAALHSAVVDTLLQRIETGEASAQEIAQAINILKHDNIQLSKDDDPAMQALEERAKERLHILQKESDAVTDIDRITSWKGLSIS